MEHNIKVAYGNTLRLMDMPGFLRCVRCHVSKPRLTGFNECDITDAIATCIDCVAKAKAESKTKKKRKTKTK